MFRCRKKFLAGLQAGHTAGYNQALQQIEALLQAEMKKVSKSKTITAKDVRLGELYWVLHKVKGFKK